MSEWASVWIKFSHPFPADGLCPSLFSAPNLHLFLPTPIRQRKSLCKSSVPKRHKIAATNSQIPGLWSLPPPEKLHLQPSKGLVSSVVQHARPICDVWWRWERKLGWNAQFATEEMAAVWGVSSDWRHHSKIFPKRMLKGKHGWKFRLSFFEDQNSYYIFQT